MKMSWTQKVVALITATLLSAGMMSACKPSSSGTTGSGQPAQAEKQMKNMKIFAEMSGQSSQSIKNYGENLVFQEMEKKTGVKVEWIHPPTGQGKEQFNLMVASNDLPDVIMYNWLDVPGGPRKYVDDGIIIDLTPHMEKNAPNFMKLMSDSPEAKKQAMDDQSKYYFFPMLRLVDSLRIFNGPQVRMDWVEKLGLKKPATVDDWYTMLKAFKEKDPNGNGKADEWPMTGMKFTGSNGIGNFAAAWGISYDFHVDGNSIKYGPLNPKFKDVLTFVNKLFSEGLIDPDYMLNNRDKQDAKVTSALSGAMYGVQPTKFMRTMAESGRDPKFRMEGAPWPTGPAGKSYALDNSYIRQVAAPCAAVTKKAKYPAEVVAWFDYAYGKEGNLLFNLGVENMTYTMSNGVATYTDLILKNKDGLSPDGAYGKYNMALNGWAMSQDVLYHKQLMGQYGYPAADNWRGANTSLIMPPISFTPEETQTVARKKTDIDTYAQEMFDKFTTGKEPIANYEKFVQKLKEMGVDDLTKLYQTAFDRYQKRGSK